MSLEEIQKLKEELSNEELDFDNLMRLNILDRIEQYLEDEEENSVCTFNGNRGVFSFDDLVYELECRFNDTIETLLNNCVKYEEKSKMCEPAKDTEFIVIENRHQTNFENKQLAMDYYLDLCDWCEGAERDSYMEMYSRIKHSKSNIITDGSVVESTRTLTVKEFKEEQAAVEKYLEEESLEY